MTPLSWLEISAENLAHNLNEFKKKIPTGTLISPCVKANAYGHGILEVSKLLEKFGTGWLTVNSIEEATLLRQNNITLPLLIIGYIHPQNYEHLFDLKNIYLFVSNLEQASALSAAAEKQNQLVNIFLKIDTGMSRQGVLADSALVFFQTTQKMHSLNISGVATHFASADDLSDPTFFNEQLFSFTKIKNILSKLKPDLIFSASNSAGALVYSEAHFDLIRPGISIYGLLPDYRQKENYSQHNIDLKPILSWKTHITQIKNIPAGSKISYGLTYTAPQDMTIAILPIGYYDGLDRKLSNTGEVIINGQFVPIIGRVCMDLTIIDVSHIPNIATEDEVIIIGKQKTAEITADDLAQKIGTINYEVTTRIRETMPRVIV